jgi:multiple sugar transport system substrate-binding protein
MEKTTMRKNIVLIISLLVTVGLLLSACGNPATPTAESEPPAAQNPPAANQPAAEPTKPPAPPASSSPVSFSIWTMPNGADPQGYIDAEIAEYVATHPDVSITAEIVGWGDAYGRIQTAVQGGEGPCISQLGTTWVPTFGAMGGLRPFPAAEVNAVGGEAGFVAASWETALVEGQVYAIPWFADIRGITYRKDILEKAGLTNAIFKDMDSFVAGLQKIKDAGLTDASGTPDRSVYPYRTQ